MQDYKFIRVGAKVYYNDPAIYDYPEDIREDVKNTIYTVFDIKAENVANIEDDTIICVSSEDGGEAEVYARELKPAFCHLTEKQRKAFMALKVAFHNCNKEGIRFVHCDYGNELLALNGEDIDEILWDEDSNEADFETIRLDEAVAPYAFHVISDDSCANGENNLWIKLKSRSNE